VIISQAMNIYLRVPLRISMKFVEACQYILDGITQLFKTDVRAIVVYGSYARLTPQKDSDIDLLVVISDVCNEKITRTKLRDFALEFARRFQGKSLSPVLMSESDFTDNINHSAPLIVGIFYAYDILYGEEYFENWMKKLEKKVIAQNLCVQGAGFRYSPRTLIH